MLVALAHAFADLQQRACTEEEEEEEKEEEEEAAEQQKEEQEEEEQEVAQVVEGAAGEELDLRDGAVLSAMSLEQLLDRVRRQEQEPPEARQLRLQLQLQLRGSARARARLYEHSETAVKRAYSECPNLALLLRACLQAPLHELHTRCRLQMGIPVAPMLAKPTKQVAEVLTRLSGLAFSLEYKYDGERAQVHVLSDDTVKIFSRNSEDNSDKYPDLRDVIRSVDAVPAHGNNARLVDDGLHIVRAQLVRSLGPGAHSRMCCAVLCCAVLCCAV